MSRLIIPYSVLIIIFCLGSTLLLLGSPHHVDIQFLGATTASLIFFPLTAYFLRKSYSAGKKVSLTIFLLFLTGCILLYYTSDFLFNSIGGISSIILFPFAVLLLTILFIINLLIRRKAQIDL